MQLAELTILWRLCRIQNRIYIHYIEEGKEERGGKRAIMSGYQRFTVWFGHW